MNDIYKKFVNAHNKALNERREDGVDSGTFYPATDIYGLADNGYNTGYVSACCVYYSCEELVTYRDEKYLYQIIGACEHIIKNLNPDGTNDMLISNFNTPATFETGYFCEGFFIFEKYSRGTALENKARDAMIKVINKLASGMLASGFHTPNHRWVESAALMGTYKITGRKELLDKANKYLAEGIDIDEYGEFTERSSGMYNNVNDWALFNIAQWGDKPELLEHIYNNLKLMFNYYEADGTVFTQNSRRKDKGEVSVSAKWYPTKNFWLYLYFAYLKNDMLFAKEAEHIFDINEENGLGIPNGIVLYLLYPELKTWKPDTSGVTLPDKYEIYQPKSNIFRVRNDKWSYSLLGNENSNFLFFRNGKTKCYMRVCASFFAVAQFSAKKLEKTETGYKMHFRAHGEYRLPYENPPKTSVWEEMDYSARGVVMPENLNIDVELTPKDDGFDINVKTSEHDNVPIKIETVISAGTRIFTDSAVQTAKAGGSFVLKSGELSLDDTAGNLITVNGAFATHLYAEDMRGSLPQSGDAFSVYFTAQTPIDKTVSVRFSRRNKPFCM